MVSRGEAGPRKAHRLSQSEGQITREERPPAPREVFYEIHYEVCSLDSCLLPDGRRDGLVGACPTCYTPYGPYGPVLRPYNPYLPFTPGQQRGWQEAKIYEQTGLLPSRPMTPNEAATFNRTIIRDAWRQAYPGYALYQYYYVVPSYPW